MDGLRRVVYRLRERGGGRGRFEEECVCYG